MQAGQLILVELGQVLDVKGMQLGHFNLQQLALLHARPFGLPKSLPKLVDQRLELSSFAVCSLLDLFEREVQSLDFLALLHAQLNELLLLACQRVLLTLEQALNVLLLQFGELIDALLLAKDLLLRGLSEGLYLVQEVLLFLLDRGELQIYFFVFACGLLGLLLHLHVLVGQVSFELYDPVFVLPNLHVLLQLQVFEGSPHVVSALPDDLVELQVP